MNAAEVADSELRNAIQNGRVILVAGSGVSIAASYDVAKKQSHPQASWTGLLVSGLKWLKEHNLIDLEEADAQIILLKKNAQTHRFISAAEDIVTGMGGVHSIHFQKWLEQSVGSIKAYDRSVLDSLNAVRLNGHFLFTTNYDDLLLGGQGQLDRITWQDSEALINAVRSWNNEKVIYLHGHWRQPTSVVLDWKSYNRIASDKDYREDLAAFWKTNPWVYVGCGVGGLSDPDFGILFKRYAARARQAKLWDFCLVLRSQLDEFQSYFDKHKFNIRAVAFGEDHSELSQYLLSLLPDRSTTSNPLGSSVTATMAKAPRIPVAPEFYAEPDYIGSHVFVGRTAELNVLNDWAKSVDSTNLLLLEAIGGNGKSILTWEWTTNHAIQMRSDWAGRFWYSFYERGAVMQDFCSRALSYITGRPLKDFKKRKTAKLKVELLAELHARPWLFILDGLERVLVAYHRIDAAEIRDEEIDSPTDEILNRNPCDAIRDEDTDLLRALAGCKPSKILVSSRLTPRVLLNQSGQPIPGVQRLMLRGLRSPDAEKLMRSCGVIGTSAQMQEYLHQNCDNHPLVIGILAGLIVNYLPNRGNFDAWSTDPRAGIALNLGKLDLVQRRNHILHAAIADLPDASRQLLSTLALLSESVDYQTLVALNPLAPSEDALRKPTHRWNSRWLSPAEKRRVENQYKTAIEHSKVARSKLPEIVRDLEQRGLLQFEVHENRYDLHPVVRGVAAGGINMNDKELYGQRVVDHFSSQQRDAYHHAETLDDLRAGLQVVRTFLSLGQFANASKFYRGDFARALKRNVEGYAEILALLGPLFPDGWGKLPSECENSHHLSNDVASALTYLGHPKEALEAYGSVLEYNLSCENTGDVRSTLSNIARSLLVQSRPAKALQFCTQALDLATLANNPTDKWRISRLLRHIYSFLGQWDKVDTISANCDEIASRLLVATGSQWRFENAQSELWRGTLSQDSFTAFELATNEGQNRKGVRLLNRIRGEWLVEESEWELAAESLSTAVQLARERGLFESISETALVLSKIQLGELSGNDALNEANRLSQLWQPAHRYLSMVWNAIGNEEEAKRHALDSFRSAWADGEPYVHRYELERATELLEKMGISSAVLPSYDQNKDEVFAWEFNLQAHIAIIKGEKGRI